MAPDELAHLQRADAVTFGPSGFTTRPTASGGRQTLVRNHVAFLDAATPFERLKFQPNEKVRASDYVAAGQHRLDGRLSDVPPGQALNLVLYLPSAAAVALGRHEGWRVIDTLRVARLLNALATVALGIAALCVAGNARLPLFALLTLPMTLALGASVSQDGPLIGVAAVTAALLAGGMTEGRPLSRGETIAAAVGMAMLAMAKPPYALLCLLLFAAPTEHRATKWFSGGLALALAAGWNAWTIYAGWGAPPPPSMGIDPSAQVGFILDHAASLPGILAETWRVRGYGVMLGFVGSLGWQDTPLPERFYPVVNWMLVLALAGAVGVGLKRGWRIMRPAAGVVVLATVVATALALYVAWSAPGAPVIEGLQGRYFLPVAMFLPLAVLGERPLLGEARTPVAVMVLAFPFVSLAVTLQSVIGRYYLHP